MLYRKVLTETETWFGTETDHFTMNEFLDVMSLIAFLVKVVDVKAVYCGIPENCAIREYCK